MSKISKLSQVQGPWKVDEGSKSLILDSKNSELAQVICNSDAAKVEMLSNLIAAAPELLLALYETVILIKHWHGAEGWNTYYKKAPELRAIRYAIAKANGELGA